MRTLPRLATLFLLLTPLGARAADPATPPCQVHLILFVPADVKPPANPQPRIDQIVTYTESFLQRELKRWGHDRTVSPFRRSPNGRAEFTLIRGKQPTAQYKPVAVRAEVMDHLRDQNKLTDHRQVWWILVYPGDPPARFASFLGGFGHQIGGWSVCNFDTTPGRIDPATPLGADFLEKIALKGMIHELGHAFQLPHVGPLNRDNAGNTLMGPTHFNFRRVTSRDENRVYLSEAEAAMLATHPAFRGLPDHRAPLPKPDVQNLRYTANPKTRTLTVTGRVRAPAPHRPVYALVADESDARPGEYWTKTYTAKVAPDGAFQVTITEPAESNGTLKTWFAFDTGAQTGDGQSRGRDSGLPQPYTYTRQQWTFK